MSTGLLTTGQKLNGFMFHRKELILSVLWVVGAVLFFPPLAAALDTIELTFLETESGFTTLGLVSLVLGAVCLSVAIIWQWLKNNR